MESGQNNIVHLSTASVIKVILCVICAVLLYVLGDIVLIALTSIVIASAINPGVEWFVARKIPRGVGVITIYTGVALAFMSIVLFVLPTLITDFSTVLEKATHSASNSDSVKKAFTGTLVEPYLPLFKNISFSDVTKEVTDKVGGNTHNPLQTATTIFGGILSFVLVVVLSFYFSVTKDGVKNFLQIITPQRHEAYVIDLWTRTQKKIGAWMQGQLVLGILVGVLTFLFLSIFKIKHALLLGVLAGVFELIPLFGSTLAAVPAVFVGFNQGGFPTALTVVFIYLVIQQFENHLFYPQVVKKLVGISPLLVILALVIGAKLGGVVGVILAIPASVLLVEYLEDVDKRKANHKH
jgi:predicted PurR-regulated permease PerM